PFGLLALATLLMITLTEVTSNTATTGMMVPVILAICSASGVDSVPVIVCATVAASYAFMLPVATPPNAIVYGTRAIRMGSMVRFGLVMDGVGYAIVLALGFWLMG
ncbi:MAG: anion permease, partial [Nannocystaceae bacterium]